ncbi:hypothetical protein GN958_ATG06751 [Phytophthora infestans]|uniref:Uncharacterized protein n=1 Tax=Phytophthora infestans TaxID=4787 RepID=A0A8S9UYI7_PHYIN|nr:hypothetical protein GN958_ATG06751 [Phytophthora infestans]
MVDRRPDKEAFRLPPPSKTVSPSGRSMYAEPKSQQSAYSCKQAIEFDTLYPNIVSSRDRKI